MRRRSLLRLALAAAAAITTASAAGSCLSPTLPLPPPDVNRIVEDDGGMWTVSGTCATGASVTILNTTTGRGIVSEDLARTGVYIITIAASAGDQGVATQTVTGELSSEEPFTFVALGQGAGGAGGSGGASSGSSTSGSSSTGP